MTLGGSDVSVFAGVNGPASEPDAIGLNIGDTEFGLVIAQDGQHDRGHKCFGFEASGDATFVGIHGFDAIRFGEIEIEVNKNSSAAANFVDFGQLDGGGYDVTSGQLFGSDDFVIHGNRDGKTDVSGNHSGWFSLDEGMDFDAGALLFAVLNDPVNMLNGTEGFFGALDGTADSVGNIRIPMIGSAGFDNFAAVLETCESLFLGNKSGSTYQDGLGLWLRSRCQW